MSDSKNTPSSNFANIPDEMKAHPNFVLYKLENRGGAKPAKVPYSVHGDMAKVNDPSTCATFEEVMRVFQNGGYDGIGFVFENTPFIGIDIDGCYDEQGTLSEAATDAWHLAQSYTELSQSDKGLHIIMRGTLPPGERRNTQTGFEMYGHGSPRYFAMTGNVGQQTLPIRECQAAISEIHAKYIAAPVPTSVALAVPKGAVSDEPERNAGTNDSASDLEYLNIGLKQDPYFIGLWNGERPHGNESSDDMAFMNKLAYWCNGNVKLMKQAFFDSPHYDQKDTAHKQKCQRDDYMRSTIDTALSGLTGTAQADNIAWQQQQIAPESSADDDIAETTMFQPLTPFELRDASPTPSFPTEMLPDLLRRVTEAVSESLQVACDMVAVCLLTIISLCVQKRFKVNPKGDWFEPVNLYTLIIARSSDRKSPVLGWGMQAVSQFVADYNEQIAPKISEYKTKCDILRRRIESHKRAFADNKKLNGVIPTEAVILKLVHELSELEKNPVNELTLTASDATTEALAAEMAANHEKLGIVSDEGGMFQILSGLYSKGTANIDAVLNAFNGSAIQIIRKTGKKIDLKRPLLTILLMAQPSVLEEVMENKQFVGRGLLARFLYSLPDSFVGSREYEDVSVPAAIESEYTEFIYRLLDFASSGQTDIIKYTPEAHAEAKALHDEFEPTLRNGDSPAVEEWGGKFEGKVARIAAILHIVEHVELAADIPISGETYAQARSIGDYFIAHAHAAYNQMGVAEAQATSDAKYIWRHLLKAGVDEISKRDLQQKVCSRNRFPKATDIIPGLDVLVERGYIAICKVAPAQNTKNRAIGGRPPEMVYINPLLTESEEVTS